MELVITDANLISALKKADPTISDFFGALFPDTNLKGDILDIVNSYEAACAIEGITPLTLAHFSFLPEKDREYQFYVHQDTVITRALNEGWEPDYSDDDQEKWYPIFVWDEAAAGGPGFSYAVCYSDGSYSSVGARRTFKSKELSEFSGKTFIHIHNKIHSLKTI